MKKIIFSIFALAAVSLGFVSCGDDDDPVITHEKSAAEACEGTYAGKWTAFEAQAHRDGDSLVVASSDGSLTFAPTDNKYVANLTMKSVSTEDVFNINVTDKVNISWANNIIRFSNPKATCNFGCAVGSEIVDGKVEVRIVKSVKVPGSRQPKTVYYKFVGQKQ